MQEEVENRTLTLVVSGTKFTGRMFKAAISKYMAHRKDPRVNVHSCLTILMPCQILNCLWVNARIEQMRRIERFKYCSVNRIDIFQRERPFPYRTFFRSIPLFMFNCIRFPCLL